MSSIKLEKVCLDYILKTGSDSLKKLAVDTLNKLLKQLSSDQASCRNTSFRALNNINLEIKMGDRLGIIGRNGAGKSTLLRVLAKVYKPNIGQIEINGNISSIFDINLGMNPEATGYENIINLSILRGLSKRTAQSLIGDVEEFTELGDFLNNPVRTYSSGMQIKLAFGVSTSLPTEIMLIDEIIGVGDMQFIEKATRRLEEKIEQSHILVLTSHSENIIKRFCNKVIVLKYGEIVFTGGVDEGMNFYKKGIEA